MKNNTALALLLCLFLLASGCKAYSCGCPMAEQGSKAAATAPKLKSSR